MQKVIFLNGGVTTMKVDTLNDDLKSGYRITKIVPQKVSSSTQAYGGFLVIMANADG